MKGGTDLQNAYRSAEFCSIGVQATPEEGTLPSPRNKTPSPFWPMQWPITFLISPYSRSCDTMLILPLPSPRTPAVSGGESGPGLCWLYPQLQNESISKKENATVHEFCFKHKSFQSVIPKSQWDIKNRAIAEPQGKQISHQRTNRWSTIAILDFIVTLIIWVFATGGIRPVKGGASRVRTRHNVLVGLVLLLGRLPTQN